MIRHQAYRYELKPTKAQVDHFKQSCGTSRYAYNWALSKIFQALEAKESIPSAIDLHRQLNVLKKDELAWMYEVSKCAPQEALRDAEVAKKRWFDKKLVAKKPRFKKKGRCRDSYRLTGSIKATTKHIQLPKVGRVRTKEPTYKLHGRILSATISREADRWFCSLQVRREVEEPQPPQGHPVGVDLGIKAFTFDSNKNKTKAPKPLKKQLRKIQHLGRSLARKEKGSKRREKAKLQLARAYSRLRNVRKDFLHKLSSYYAKAKQVVVVEDLSVAGMVHNRKLARAISDLGMGEFVRMLEYKTEWYGSTLIKIDRWFPSSKKCCRCGHIKKDLKLSDRTYLCPCCELKIDRDFNASNNILIEGLESSGLITNYPEFQGKLSSWRSISNPCCCGKGDRRNEKQTSNARFE